eukprot:2186029-Pyramimonas_sp.AAC.1
MKCLIKGLMPATSPNTWARRTGCNIDCKRDRREATEALLGDDGEMGERTTSLRRGNLQGVKVWRQASSVEKRLGSGPIIKTMVNTYLDRGELGAGGDRIVHKNNTWGAWHQSGLYTEQNLQLRNAA